MIGLGATLVSQFSWVLYLFGAFLVITGIKMWFMADSEPDIENNAILKFLRKRMRVTEGLRGNAFVVNEPDPKTGKVVRFATPLLLALVLIEFVDLIRRVTDPTGCCTSRSGDQMTTEHKHDGCRRRGASGPSRSMR